MFVGAELLPDTPPPESLEKLEFELQRYLSHLHIGAYQDLPAKWQALKTELAARGESLAWPSLEVYGHSCEDESQAQTTILIGLKPNEGVRSS
jgi:effector-binding domain-containing protein